MGRSQRVGHRVVDIRELGGAVAAWKPTGQIPTADEPLQLGRWAVTRLGWAITGEVDAFLGRVGEQLESG